MEAGGRGYVGLGAQLCMFQSCTLNNNSTKAVTSLKKEIKTGPVPYPALLFLVRGDNCEIVGVEIGGRSEYTAGRSEYTAGRSEYMAGRSEYMAGRSEYMAGRSEYTATRSGFSARCKNSVGKRPLAKLLLYVGRARM
jgi:hypothetical protein